MKRIALLVAVVLAVSGCGTDEPGREQGGSMEEQRAELLRRPSIEEASTRYSDMHTKIREGLTTTFPWMQWEQTQELTRAGCSDFDAFTYVGESQTLGVWRANGTVPDAEWARAQKLVGDITSEFGFPAPQAVVDRPADHEVTSSDQYGAAYSFGTAKNTVLSGSTGCHLPQAEKDKQAQPPQ